jgi:hypothetical protein
MSVILNEEGKEDILKRASFLRLPITKEQLQGNLEVVRDYSISNNYVIAIPKCFQRMAISKTYCSCCA